MKSFLAINAQFGLVWAVVKNPGQENEEIELVVNGFEEAIEFAAELGNGADVMKVTFDGSLTTEF